MLNQNFGGFTPSLPGIDIQFPSVDHLNHFEGAWGRFGRPKLENDGPDRLGLMCVGTVVEHELRHFHDFLLNRDLLLSSWLRRRMSMNALPSIMTMLKSQTFDVIPYPLIEWARLPERSRAKRRAELERLFPTDRRRFWSPPMLPARIQPPKSAVNQAPRSEPEAEQAMRRALQAVREDMRTSAPLRAGLDDPAYGKMRFTPRYAFEVSALNAQLHAVIKTYGMNEGTEFLAMLAGQGTAYSRFFIQALQVLTGVSRPNARQGEPIDLPKLSAVAFWIMTGCRDDGPKGGPATRLAMLMSAASDDWVSIFPAGLTVTELVDHFDSMMGCVPFRDSLARTQTEMEWHLAAARQLLESEPDESKLQLSTVATYDSVLSCRRSLVSRIIAQPETYIDPYLWMGDLTIWPQCPVHMRFSAGRFGVPRERFAQYPSDAQYNVTTNLPLAQVNDWVGDVYLQSFFLAMDEIPLAPVIQHQRLNLLFDLLIEPDSMRPHDVMALRDFARTQYGKELVHLI
ncbi:hypothetical protein NI456_11230 [Brevundimonas diminuta]|uniref:hypothetical protein n=1 Tax=Brevundimonas diminuta TaxID=293 RepID=UPI0020977474|nr:hypothetical protein [Brevundimonas diminuta]MCO8019429.1 hypothetical protein [Brevundimonas diminuta]MCO8022107.1 hypothetical protein [Brevundimonas diminuta]